MLISNVELDFVNLTPTTQERTILGQILKNIKNSAPARSLLKLTLKSTDKGIFGVLSVYSHAGQFHATTTEATFLKQIRILETDLLKQFENWKKNRFCEPQFHL